MYERLDLVEDGNFSGERNRISRTKQNIEAEIGATHIYTHK